MLISLLFLRNKLTKIRNREFSTFAVLDFLIFMSEILNKKNYSYLLVKLFTNQQLVTIDIFTEKDG